jgi:hypothetical protein
MVFDSSNGINRFEKNPNLGYFGIITAFILCCLIVGYLTYISGIQGERRDKTPASYSQAAKEDAYAACVEIKGNAAFECIYEKVETSQDQARGEQDLDAQQRAAFAALTSAFIAFLTLILSGFGVWFVKRTLDATLRAVEDTGKATKAMQDANQLAKESSQMQLRAYVSIKTFATPSIHQLGLVGYNASIKAVNHGQTPAIDIEQWSQTFIAKWPLEECDIPSDWQWCGSGAILHCGEEIDFGARFDLCPQDEIKEIVIQDDYTRTVAVYLAAKVEYKDVFGHDAVERYCCAIFYPPNSQLSRSVIAAAGNGHS